MLTTTRLAVAASLTLALSACSPPMATRVQDPPGTPTRPQHHSHAASAEVYPLLEPAPPEIKSGTETNPSPGISPPPPPPIAKPAVRPPTAPSSAPAVLALLNEADANTASGDLASAAATLERAIRIQPRNAESWQKLAEVRLRQEQPGLAEDLAKKSNLLAKGNAALTRKNWTLIAQARVKKGDAAGAAEASAKAGQ